jgi:hypothetical protein
MRPGDAVDPVHEVEGVHEARQPHRDGQGDHGEDGHRQVQPSGQRPGDERAPGHLQDQPPAGRQPAQVINQAEDAEEGDRGAERQRLTRRAGHWVCEPLACECRGHHQAERDRGTAATRRGYRVRRPVPRHVDHHEPAQQGDRQWFGHYDDRAAQQDSLRHPRPRGPDPATVSARLGATSRTAAARAGYAWLARPPCRNSRTSRSRIRHSHPARWPC